VTNTFMKTREFSISFIERMHLNLNVGNELVHAGSHARPQAVDRGIPSQGGSTE